MQIPLHEIPILTYHKICRSSEWGINVISPDQFFRHMQYLYENEYQPLTFQDLTSGPPTKKPVIITFDDGYQLIYKYALPILKEFKFKAVIFVITGYLGKWNSWDANLGGKKFKHLTKNELLTLAAEHMELGSHGVTHRALPFLTETEIFSELSRSREKIKKITCQPVISLAYPFGMQTRPIQHIASDCGYRYGLINLWGMNHKSHPLCLKRTPVYRLDTLSSLKKKLQSGFYNKIERTKLKILSAPAFLTPIYQILRKKHAKR